MKESSHVRLASPSGFSTVGLRPAFPSRGARERCLNRAEGTILSFYQESIVHCLNQQFPTVLIAPLKVKVFNFKVHVAVTSIQTGSSDH